MENEKATRPDNIPIQIITALDNLGIDLTTKLLNEICDSGTNPKDLCKSVFIVLHKTTVATECELHRTISLKSHFTKNPVTCFDALKAQKSKIRISAKHLALCLIEDRNTIFTLSMPFIKLNCP